jgi:FADH2 O2-dependent halogenase
MFDLAIVGSGFGGSLTALVASRLGLSTILLERGSHPRFAIGESSTPMSNILLESIARDFDLPRILPLARYGTWKKTYPSIGVGAKRGFSFYGHPTFRPFAAEADRSDQLLAEASPHHDVADTHWYRPDFDQFLVREAQAAGVEYVDRVELDAIERKDGASVVSGTREGRAFSASARFLVDASGPRGFLAKLLKIPESRFEGFPATQALFNHFKGVHLWQDAKPGADEGAPPYPVDDAALHHILDGGWMWVLRFDNEITSAGFALEDRLAEELRLADGAAAWPRVLERYPSIRAQFADAEPVEPWRHMPRIAYCASVSGGDGWTMLPSAAAVIDPLFSTGIPLALLGVDRIGRAIREAWGRPEFQARMRASETDARFEADAAACLVGAAYASFRSFPLFVGIASCYLASVSFSEVCYRLGDRARANGFLACRGAAYQTAFRSVADEARRLAGGARLDRRDLAAFEARVAAAIAPMNVAGFCDPSRRNWYPVDFGALLESAPKLGRSRPALEAFLQAQGMGRWLDRRPD